MVDWVLLDTTRLELNVSLLVVGTIILVIGLLREFLSTKAPASETLVAMFVGIIFGPHVLNVVNLSRWGHAETVVQEVARVVISIQLAATALRLPFHFLQKAWRAQLVLLTAVLAIMWVVGGLLIYAFFSFGDGFRFTIWEALLIGACIAPTDPVVSSAVVQSVLAIKLVPSRVRNTIISESSFNDGLGFPLVYLGLLYVTKKDESGGVVFGEWIVQGVLYEVVLASIMSALLGYLIGKLLVWASPAKLHDQQLLVALTIALGFGFVGGFQLLGMDGVLAVMIGGVIYAFIVEGPKRGAESQLQETVDLIFSSTMFILFGVAIPFDRWHMINWWRGILLGICLLVFRRLPFVFLFKRLLIRQLKTTEDLLFVGWFGPVGVAAIFYSLYVAEQTGDDFYWVMISFIVFTQIVVFGLTDTMTTKWYGSKNLAYRQRREIKDQVSQQLERDNQAIQEAGLELQQRQLDQHEARIQLEQQQEIEQRQQQLDEQQHKLEVLHQQILRISASGSDGGGSGRSSLAGSIGGSAVHSAVHSAEVSDAEEEGGEPALDEPALQFALEEEGAVLVVRSARPSSRPSTPTEQSQLL